MWLQRGNIQEPPGGKSVLCLKRWGRASPPPPCQAWQDTKGFIVPHAGSSWVHPVVEAT